MFQGEIKGVPGMDTLKATVLPNLSSEDLKASLASHKIRKHLYHIMECILSVLRWLPQTTLKQGGIPVC